MKINWTVRIKNKAFWVAIIPALFLLVQQICGLFGVSVNLGGMSDQLIDIVGTVFAVLAMLGIVTDPTTKGVSDSERAMTYNEPN
jgi:phi LC3 family holin